MAKVNIDIAVNQRQAQQKIERLTRSTKGAQKGFDRLTVSVKQSGSAFSSFVGNVAAIGFTKLIGSMASLVGSSVKVTGEIETLKTQFEVLTGSVGLANKAVKDLQEFAASTPFQFKDLAKAEQRLLSFGFTLEETQDRMKDIGDVAAASGAGISELALIFGQVRAAGKLTGERLLQFQERAIPIGPALAKSLGVAESSIKDLVSKGKVDFETFEKAFQSLNDTGEFAFEGMTKRSRTLEGRISTLKDNFELLQANVGGKLAPAFKALVSVLTTFIQKISASKVFNDFLETLSTKIPAAIDFAIQSFSFVINSIFNVIKVFNLFRSGVTTALSVVIQAFTSFIDIYAKVINALGLGDTAIGRGINNIKGFRDGVTGALDDTAAGFAQSAADISASQETVNNAIQQGSTLIQAAYADELEAAEAQANGTIDAQTKKVQAVETLTQEEIASLEKLKAAKESLKLAEEGDRLLQQGNDQIFLEEKLIRLQEFFTAEQEASIQAKINLADNEIEKQRLITEAQAMAISNRQKLEKENLDELRKGQDDYTKFLEQQGKDRQTNQRAVLSNISTLAQSSSKELASIGKAAAITQIAIDTEKAVSGAYAFGNSFGGPVLGAILGAVAATAQAARAANVAGIGFETGGIVPGTSFTGDNVAANVNSGEMVLTRQQQSQLFNMANGQNGNGLGQQEIVINNVIELDGETVANSVSRHVANGLVLGEVQ